MRHVHDSPTANVHTKNHYSLLVQKLPRPSFFWFKSCPGHHSSLTQNAHSSEWHTWLVPFFLKDNASGTHKEKGSAAIPPLPTRPQTNCSLKERIQIRDHYSAVNTGNLAVTFHVWQEATLCILRTGNSLQPYSCLSKASQQPHFPLQPPLFM